MTNYVPFPIDNIEEIKIEIKDYISEFLYAGTEEDITKMVLDYNVRIRMNKGIPSYSMPYICPKLHRLLEEQKAKYGKIVDDSIWIGVSNSSTPILSAPDRKFNLIIPCIIPANFKIQYYDYNGSVSSSTSSNDGVNFTTINLPDNPSLLTHSETITEPGAGWVRVDKMHSISNWSSKLFVYLSLKFENQDLIESELFS